MNYVRANTRPLHLLQSNGFDHYRERRPSGPTLDNLGHMQSEYGPGVGRRANQNVTERQLVNVELGACDYWLVGSTGTVLWGRETTEYKHNQGNAKKWIG